MQKINQPTYSSDIQLAESEIIRKDNELYIIYVHRIIDFQVGSDGKQEEEELGTTFWLDFV